MAGEVICKLHMTLLKQSFEGFFSKENVAVSYGRFGMMKVVEVISR